MKQEQQLRRPHIYELDPLRICTALGVVAVHTLSGTTFLDHTVGGVEFQNAAVITFHFTREVFMFLTAFAMVYVYYGKTFHVQRFWLKRSIGVLLPYCLWSVVYTWVNMSTHAPLVFTQAVLFNIVTGNASYQLYYILLTIQFYIILPFFLLFLKSVAKHPWTVLSISFVLQVVGIYIDYHTLQAGNVPLSGFWQFFAQYQNRIVFVYQFYFVLGGFVALYWRQVRAFILTHGYLCLCSLLIACASLWFHFVLQVRVYQESLGFATAVLQPIMIFYSLAVIFGFLYVLSRWTSHVGAEGYPRNYKLWHSLSDASFGVYLIHVLFLTELLRWVTPAMPTILPVAVRVFLTWFLTAGVSVAIVMLMLRIPVLSRLFGREYKRNTLSRRTISPHSNSISKDARDSRDSKDYSQLLQPVHTSVRLEALSKNHLDV